MNFADTAATYARRERVRISVATVVHSGLQDWALDVRRFCNSIPEALRPHPLWKEAVIRLRYLSSDLCSTPLPFSILGEIHRVGMERLTETLANAYTGFPDLVSDAQPLVERAIRLTESHENPLLEHAFVEALLGDAESPVGLLLARPKRLDLVREALSELSVEWTELFPSASSLSASSGLARVLCVGPPNSFSEVVLFSPAAEDLVFLSYSFFPKLQAPRRLAPGKPVSTDRWLAVGLSAPDSSWEPAEGDAVDSSVLEDEFVVPSLDWRVFMRSLKEDDTTGDEDGAVQLVEARPILLSGGFVVLIGGHEGAKASVVQFVGGVADVQIVRVRDIETGTFLLVRTEGGGDLVLELSKRFLGEQADEIETAQLTWKVALLEEIRVRGLSLTSDWLNRKGVSSANEGTLRYWVSADSIQPASESDYHGLMDALGLGQDAAATWAMGRVLRAARLKAAHAIRRQLIAAVASTRESDFSSGRMDFTMGEASGGTLAAWRVVEVAPTTTLVNANRIGIPESVEEQLWLG